MVSCAQRPIYCYNYRYQLLLQLICGANYCYSVFVCACHFGAMISVDQAQSILFFILIEKHSFESEGRQSFTRSFRHCADTSSGLYFWRQTHSKK